MPPSNVDITRAAHLLIQQRGDEATTRARQKVEVMRSKGDGACALVAIGRSSAWQRSVLPAC
jgi:hypothetical protein